MAAYLIAQLTITDRSYLPEYRAGMAPLLAKHGGRQLVGGKPSEKLEGDDWVLPDHAVVVEFPTMEAARAWYYDPDNEPLIKLRQSGAAGKLMLVDGIGAA